MPRSFLSGPFGFKDRSMELRYREDWVSSCLNRNRPLLCNFYLPAIACMRISWFLYWIFYPYDLTTIEVIVNFIRMGVLMFVFSIFIKDWSDTAMTKFGLVLIWISRCLLLLLLLQQIAAETNDSQTMIAITTILCCGGLVIPNFSEFLGFALTLPFVRPLKIFMASPEGLHDERLHQVLFQHSLLLSLAVSFTWTIHADSRHKWLCSAATSADRECPRIESASLNPRAAAAPYDPRGPDWDLLADDYFSDADRAELRDQALEVPPIPVTRTPPLPPLSSAGDFEYLATFSPEAEASHISPSSHVSPLIRRKRITDSMGGDSPPRAYILDAPPPSCTLPLLRHLNPRLP
jgi:hypothetical protein